MGSFEVARLAKASDPLKGVKAKQVKLVVTSNHGNAQSTESAEVDLLGTGLGTAPPMQLGGVFATNTDAFNLDLSQRRSKAVVDWLTTHGVDAQRLEAEGFDRARPVADNASAQGRALNRRVEVSVLR